MFGGTEAFEWMRGGNVTQVSCCRHITVQLVVGASAVWLLLCKVSVAYRGGLGCSNPPHQNSEGPPKSCQTQPDCENG